MNRRRFFIAGAALTATLTDTEARAQDRGPRELAAYAALSEAFMNLANSPRPAGDLAERLVFRQHETPCFDALRNLGLANRQVINGLYQKNCPSQKDFPALEGAAVAIDAETSRFAARSKDLARIIKPTDLRDAIYKASTDLGAVIRHEWPHEINKYCAFSIPEKMAYVDRITASSRAARQCEGALNAASRKVDPWG